MFIQFESAIDAMDGPVPLERPFGPAAYMDDNGLPCAVVDVDFLGSSDVKVAKIGFQLIVGCLQVEQGLQTNGQYMLMRSRRGLSGLTWATDSSNSSGSAPFSLTIFLLRAVNAMVAGL